MSTLWDTVDEDIVNERFEAQLAQARIAAANVWGFLAKAETHAEYMNRRAMADDRIVRAVQSVSGDDIATHAALYPALVASLDEDFTVLARHREATRREAAKRQRVANTRDRYLRGRRSAGLNPRHATTFASRKQAAEAGYDWLPVVRRIVENRQAEEIDGVLVDMQSANLLLSMHDALKPANQERFTSGHISEAWYIAEQAMDRGLIGYASRTAAGDWFQCEHCGGNIVHREDGWVGGPGHVLSTYCKVNGEDGHEPNTDAPTGWRNNASRTAAESTSDTCSVCGDSIERDPGSEKPQTWHHNNGEKHDHEAKPSGSKESYRRTAVAVCVNCGGPVLNPVKGFGDLQICDPCAANTPPYDDRPIDDKMNEWVNSLPADQRMHIPDAWIEQQARRRATHIALSVENVSPGGEVTVSAPGESPSSLRRLLKGLGRATVVDNKDGTFEVSVGKGKQDEAAKILRGASRRRHIAAFEVYNPVRDVVLAGPFDSIEAAEVAMLEMYPSSGDYDADTARYREQGTPDYADGSLNVVVRQTASRKQAAESCPDCGMEGCSPDCRGPLSTTICDECGSQAAVRDGKTQCVVCGKGHPTGGYTKFDDGFATAKVVVECNACGQRGKISLAKVSAKTTCRCGSLDIDFAKHDPKCHDCDDTGFIVGDGDDVGQPCRWCGAHPEVARQRKRDNTPPGRRHETGTRKQAEADYTRRLAKCNSCGYSWPSRKEGSSSDCPRCRSNDITRSKATGKKAERKVASWDIEDDEAWWQGVDLAPGSDLRQFEMQVFPADDGAGGWIYLVHVPNSERRTISGHVRPDEGSIDDAMEIAEAVLRNEFGIDAHDESSDPYDDGMYASRRKATGKKAKRARFEQLTARVKNDNPWLTDDQVKHVAREAILRSQAASDHCKKCGRLIEDDQTRKVIHEGEDKGQYHSHCAPKG